MVRFHLRLNHRQLSDMDANRLSLDPALASQIIESLGQELKAVKQRLTEAEEVRHAYSSLSLLL